MDYAILDFLRQNHPSWRLLRASHAPLMGSFLYRMFVVPNARNIAQADLVEALEDELFMLREQLGEDVFPGSAQSYLNDWAEDGKGYLRRFYPMGSDEPHFDLTSATGKALAWLEGLTERSFIGTESRLLTIFELLQQMCTGGQDDPKARIAALQKRRDEIDTEIARVVAGDMPLLGDTSIKDRFQQFLQMSRELLADFREVEHNFRILDRRVREQIALGDGGKGALLEEIMGERDAIADSDQGRSFHAFWDFLMSRSRQEEFGELLAQVLALPAVVEMQPDSRLRQVHYDWLAAGEHTQRTVAQLSAELRRFLDDKAWLENRRIMSVLHSVESHALALRDAFPTDEIMSLPSMAASVELPLERPLYRPPHRLKITVMALDEGDADVDMTSLYAQVVIDKEVLKQNIRKALQNRRQISLSELIVQVPLQHGLAELVAYFSWQRLGVMPLWMIRCKIRCVGTERKGRCGKHAFRGLFFYRKRSNGRMAEYEQEGDSADMLSVLIVSLLKGVIYQEDNPKLWQALWHGQAAVRDYVAVLGLDLMLDEAEGYAFLRSRDVAEADGSGQAAPPRLIARRQLSYPVSLLLALLRKKLAEFDREGGDTRLILTKEDVVELIRIFFPASHNEVKLIDQIDSHLNKVAELGFIRRLRGEENKIEVRRILKAFVDAQWLSDFDARLAEYRTQFGPVEEDEDAGDA